jgi:hypothetical protein
MQVKAHMDPCFTLISGCLIGMLEEFVMAILEEESRYYMLFLQDRAPPHFHKEVTD